MDSENMEEQKNHTASVSQSSYLLIGHELERRLGGNFEDVDAVSSPQRPHAALFDHLHQAAHDAHVVGAGSIHLMWKKVRRILLTKFMYCIYRGYRESFAISRCGGMESKF